MKPIRSLTLVRLGTLTLLAACLSAGLAWAQAAAGKFTLPFEARWGLAILPAGDYSFTVDQPGLTSLLTISRGTRSVALIKCQSYSMTSSGASELTVVRDGRGNTVRDLRLPQIGMVFHYAPNKPRRTGKASEEEAARAVPVFTAAK